MLHQRVSLGTGDNGCYYWWWEQKILLEGRYPLGAGGLHCCAPRSRKPNWPTAFSPRLHTPGTQKNHDHVSLTRRSSPKRAPCRTQQPVPQLHWQHPSLSVGADLTLAEKSDTCLLQADLHLPRVTSREGPGHLGGWGSLPLSKFTAWTAKARHRWTLFTLPSISPISTHTLGLQEPSPLPLPWCPTISLKTTRKPLQCFVFTPCQIYLRSSENTCSPGKGVAGKMPTTRVGRRNTRATKHPDAPRRPRPAPDPGSTVHTPAHARRSSHPSSAQPEFMLLPHAKGRRERSAGATTQAETALLLALAAPWGHTWRSWLHFQPGKKGSHCQPWPVAEWKRS